MTTAIFDEVGSLSLEQLKLLRSRCDAALNFMEPQERDDPENMQHLRLVHDAFEFCLERAGAAGCIPFRFLPRAKHYSQFKDGAPMLLNYINNFVQPDGHHELKEALMVLTNMLARWIQETEQPLCHRTLSQACSRVHDIVDRAFPGYRESGLLPMILKARRV